MKGLLFIVLFAGAQLKNIKVNFFLQAFDKAAYYQILKSGSINKINAEIKLVDALSNENNNAFTGALLMKKAGLLKLPKEKLDTFKKGAVKLETVLHSDTSNVEYHFLRLIIQEHAPKIVKYNKDINADAAFIKKNYNALSPEVRKILIDYSQTSKALQPKDFQP